MDGRRQKRIRSVAYQENPRTQHLQNLLHTGGISVRGLGAILQKLRAADLQKTANRFELAEVNLVRFLQVRHTELVPIIGEVEPFEWEMAHPLRLVSLMIAESAELKRLFEAAAARHPCDAQHRWRIIIGFDEYIPGNKLQLHNQRKCMNLSFTFLELGLIRQDTVWFTPVILRHSVLDKVQGGWGFLFRRFLNIMLLGDLGFASTGLALELNGNPFLLYADLEVVLADLDGHRMAFDAKGAGGLRPCLFHPHVVKLGSELTGVDETFVEISCSDPSRFGRARSKDIYADVDLLAVARQRATDGLMTWGRFYNLEKTLGLNHAPHGVFSDVHLRRHVDFASVLTIDWVHCMLADGVFPIEVCLMISAAEGIVTMKDLESYMKHGWVFPVASRAKGKALWQVFDTARCPSGEKLKGSASEMLGLYSLLRHFVDTRLLAVEGIDLQKASFRASCHVIDVIMLAKQGRIPMQQASSTLRAALADQLTKHVAAYTDSHVKPKHHYMFDVADQWERQGEVVDAFVVERLHLRVKAVAEPIRNTSSFERSCLASLINTHCRVLHEEHFGNGLVGRSAPLVGTPADVADCMRVHDMQLTVGDLVFHRGV